MSEEKTEKPKEGCRSVLKTFLSIVLGAFLGNYLVSQCRGEPTFSDYLEHIERQDDNRYRWR